MERAPRHAASTSSKQTCLRGDNTPDHRLADVLVEEAPKLGDGGVNKGVFQGCFGEPSDQVRQSERYRPSRSARGPRYGFETIGCHEENEGRRI
jgi:hypothetical protein